MSTWNYRVVRTATPDPADPSQPLYAYTVVEFHYDEHQAVTGYTTTPAAPHGETYSECVEDMEKIARAFLLPVIDLSGDQPVELPQG